MKLQFTFILATVVLFFFQNCSEAKFESIPDPNVTSKTFELGGDEDSGSEESSESSEEESSGEETAEEEQGEEGSNEEESGEEVAEEEENSEEEQNEEGSEDEEEVAEEEPPGKNKRPDHSKDKENGKDKSEQVYACGANGVKDVILNVKEVLFDHKPVASLVGVLSLSEISQGFTITAGDDSEASQVRLVLEGTGNYILDQDNNLVELKTPSQQQSGLKVQVSKTAVEAGVAHDLTFDLNLSKQIVINPVKCILKPVIHGGNLN